MAADTNPAHQRLWALDQAHLWHPFTQMSLWAGDAPLIIERAEGNWLIDTQGRRWLDAISSLWVTVHGHRKAELDAAVRAQLDKVAHCTLLGQASVPSIELAAALAAIAPKGLTRVFYSDSGSTSVEVALKMAYQYWRLSGRPEKKRFAALSEAYHGDTLGSVSVGGIELFHDRFKDLLFDVERLPAPHAYRWKGKDVLGESLAAAEKLLSEKAGELAALVVEPLVQGAAGMWLQPKGYLKGLEQLCRKYDVLLICDEVATGFGRTGTMAERAEELSSAPNDPVLVLVTCIVHGYVDHLQGRSRAAGTWIERGLAAAELLELAPVEIFVADPQVTLLGLRGMHLLDSGFVEQARAGLERAHARARLLGWPNTRLAAFWYDALFEVRLGNAERVAAVADEMRALVDESEVAQGRAACQWFRGWADAQMGQPRDGYRRIREAYEDNTRLGMLAGGSEVLGYAAEALVLDGDWDGAQRELEDALKTVNRLGERVYLPQLLMMQATIARARGDRAAAAAAIRRAIAEARAQEAPWLELMARIELCDRHGAMAKDRRALAALLDQLPEVQDTPAARKARALLDKAKSA